MKPCMYLKLSHAPKKPAIACDVGKEKAKRDMGESQGPNMSCGGLNLFFKWMRVTFHVHV